MAAGTFMYNGQQHTQWTEDQLLMLSAKTLKNRARDIRDSVGEELQECLPPMPHHPELLAPWIVQVQAAMMRSAGGYDGGRPASGAEQYSPPEQYRRHGDSDPYSGMGGRGGSDSGPYPREDHGQQYQQQQRQYHDEDRQSNAGTECSRAPSSYSTLSGTTRTFMFKGKEQTMWTEAQLSQLGTKALKQRARDIRDLFGEGLGSMPHHADLLSGWIIQAQAAMMDGAGSVGGGGGGYGGGYCGDSNASGGYGGGGGGGSSASRGAPRGNPMQQQQRHDDQDRYSNAPSDVSGPSGHGEAYDAYLVNKAQRAQAQQRAWSSNIFGGS